VDERPVSVVELPRFILRAREIMHDTERERLVDHLARHPTDGDLVPGTGGVRKLRWRLEGRGKRGGARVIYYFCDHDVPLFVLTIYAKNEKADLTPAERKEFSQLTKRLRDEFRS
jgi:hypothetical protein